MSSQPERRRGRVLSPARPGTRGSINADGQVFQFEWDTWQPGGAVALRSLLDVEFDVDQGPAGPRVLKVFPAGKSPPPDVPARSRAGPVQAVQIATSGKKSEMPVEWQRPQQRTWQAGFLNPYNFVRPLNASALDTESAAVRLLGRCPPPPRDRYVGLTGTLTCSVETVSPVFVADSHDVNDTHRHRSYHFFRNERDEPCIPASTLRGVVRSVFEAATSSCWEHVAGDHSLSRRIESREAKGLVPARLTRRDGVWVLDLLTGTSSLRSNGPASGQSLYAAWVLRYARDNHEPCGQDRNGFERNPEYLARTPARVPEDMKHGDPCFARLRETPYLKRNPVTGKETSFTFWNAEALGRTRDDVYDESVDGKKVQVHRGWYSCTGRNIDNKHDERFFFVRQDLARRVTGVDEQVRRYVDLLNDYSDRFKREQRREAQEPQEEESANAQPRAEDAACELERSRFVRAEHWTEKELENGELVYARINAEHGSPVVETLAPVAIPRLFYNAKIKDRFPGDGSVQPCTEHNQSGKAAAVELCPACRVFGWVAAEVKGRTDSRAVRSRVRFTDACFADRDLEKEIPRTLDILSAPKPTTVRFYLAPVSGDLKTPQPVEAGINWDSDAVVARGRKFYRGRETRLQTTGGRTKQNRTLLGYLKPKCTATFELRFENLSRVELGALLWTLELEGDGWVHRLGYAKPLGWGALKVRVTGIAVHTGARYEVDGATDVWRPARRDAVVAALKQEFKDAMVARYSPGGAFLKLPNIEDLLALLSNSPAELPVTYPVLDNQAPNAAAETYRWFVVNRRAKKHFHRDGRGHWLDLAANDHGLPRDPSRG